MAPRLRAPRRGRHGHTAPEIVRGIATNGGRVALSLDHTATGCTTTRMLSPTGEIQRCRCHLIALIRALFVDQSRPSKHTGSGTAGSAWPPRIRLPGTCRGHTPGRNHGRCPHGLSTNVPQHHASFPTSGHRLTIPGVRSRMIYGSAVVESTCVTTGYCSRILHHRYGSASYDPITNRFGVDRSVVRVTLTMSDARFPA